MRTSRCGVFVALTIMSISLFGAAPAPAGAKSSPSSTEHCSLEIVGVNEDGSYETGPLVCDTTPTAAARASGVSAMSTIATHYEGFNFTGDSLSIAGGSCNGGWLNLPPAWRDRIASTVSGCTTRHYAGTNLSGTQQSLSSPGGNLTVLAFDTHSVKYD